MAEIRGESIGAYLRRVREAREISVAEVSRATRIPETAIGCIEADHFDDLPGEVFIRGFLRAYAVAVRLPPDDVLARYTAGRRSSAVVPLPLAAPVGRTASRRFGVAVVAFVLLLVLFTLAISIVLRPRGHDRPAELSMQAPAAAEMLPASHPVSS
jgi:cytoskeletal protein RodZ